jgi:hypothetical protein
MARIQLVRYWKRYMRKGRHYCKRYSLYPPVAIGDQLDRPVDYVVRLFGGLHRLTNILLRRRASSPPRTFGREYTDDQTSKGCC